LKAAYRGGDVEPQVLGTAIKKHALQNAILHKGKADPNAVVSKLIGEHPELVKQILTLLSQSS